MEGLLVEARDVLERTGADAVAMRHSWPWRRGSSITRSPRTRRHCAMP
jgi:hypothetical protein